jgi:hypothetical protein
MNKSKKVFAGFVVFFAVLLAYASYDIATRTTFPTRQNNGKLKVGPQKNDSTSADSTIIFEKK